MDNITIENIIATMNISSKIDLEKLHKDIQDSKIEYVFDTEKEERKALSLSFEDGNTFITVFNSGIVTSTKAKTVEDAEQSLKDFRDLLIELEYIEE